MHIFLLDLTSYINNKMAWIGMDWHRRPEAISNYQSNKIALFLICRNQKGISCMAEGKFSIDFSQWAMYHQEGKYSWHHLPYPKKVLVCYWILQLCRRYQSKNVNEAIHVSVMCDVAYSLNSIRYFFVCVSGA